jgi:hypothetical protein
MVEILHGMKRLFAAITRARNGGIRFLWNVRVCLPEHMADTFEKVANLRFLQMDALRKGDGIWECASKSCQFLIFLIPFHFAVCYL